jgi:hypothetical protein
MIVVVAVLLLMIALGVGCLVVLQGRSAYNQYRSEQAHLERSKRWAERRLHDLSSKAFESMLDAARQAPGRDHPWP